MKCVRATKRSYSGEKAGFWFRAVGDGSGYHWTEGLMDRVGFPYYSTEATLRDGGSVRIRAIRPGDKERLLDALHRLSRQSVYFRFFKAKEELTEKQLSYFTEIDFIRHVGLVVTLWECGDEHVIGVGRYIALGRHRAEVAFTVVDEHQHRGIGTLLLKRLVPIARANGIQEFTAEVLARNVQMLKVFEHSGFDLRTSFEAGVVHVSFSIKGAK